MDFFTILIAGLAFGSAFITVFFIMDLTTKQSVSAKLIDFLYKKLSNTTK